MKKPASAVAEGECCPVLGLALSRAPDSGMGLSIGTRMNFTTGETSDALVIKFRRGRKGEEHVESTFAWCLFCPFCGTRTALGQRTAAPEGSAPTKGER